MSKRFITLATFSTALVVGLVSPVFAVSPNSISTLTKTISDTHETTHLKTAGVLTRQPLLMAAPFCEGENPPPICDGEKPPKNPPSKPRPTQPSGTIVFREGNYCGQNVVITISDAPGTYNLKDFSGKNDEARSLELINVNPGTIIRVFDSPNGSKNDDWTEIYVGRFIPPRFDHRGNFRLFRRCD